MIRPGVRSLLIRFPHGLGDCVQLCGLLPAIQATYPGLAIDVAVLDASRASLFGGLARRAWVLGQEVANHDQVVTLGWHEAVQCSGLYPGTKTHRSAREDFGISLAGDAPLPRLPRAEANGPPGRYALIHYQGASGRHRKDLDHNTILKFGQFLERNGVRPLLIDQAGESPLPFDRVSAPTAAGLLAILDGAALVVAIDSGPGHLAQATATPTILVWTHNHPYHFADRWGDVVHLVPAGHERLLQAEGREAGLAYFRGHYAHRTYEPHDLAGALARLASDRLGLEQQRPEGLRMALTATSYDRRYYEEHKAMGLDYLEHGDWQRDYGAWLVGALGLPPGARVLDVGCACGSIAQGFAAAGCDVDGIDLNEHMIALGRERCDGVRLHVCDTVNLHLFPDGHFDFIHVAQVAEHWLPRHVPLILEELRRVMRPGAWLWTAHDTVELYLRQGRRIEDEDPTHVSVWPRSLWEEAYRWVGLADVSAQHRPALESHPLSYLGGGRHRYDWDWWLLQRPE